MKLKILQKFLFFMVFLSGAPALSEVIFLAGVDYTPVAKLKYPESLMPDREIVDNFIWESRCLYKFENGFEIGVVFNHYQRRFWPGGITRSDIRFWGVGLAGNYSAALNPSGRTSLLAGIETGFSGFSDHCSFGTRNTESFWAGGFTGIKHHFLGPVFFEFDLLVKWLEFDFTNPPQKKYEYSGTALRFSLGCQVLPSRASLR
jgi:hypothetical protein